MFHTSKIEISKSALIQNVNFLKNLYGNTKFSSVVKGNAYGHGIEQYAALIESVGLNHFSVFSADEALRVINCTQHKPTVMIMGMIDNEELEWAIQNDVEFYVFEHDRLDAAIKVAKKVGKKAKIHIEVETGMNRTGYTKEELEYSLEVILQNLAYVEVKGLCTHFAGAESISNHIRVQNQKKVYKKAIKWLQSKNVPVQSYHSTCSAASIRMPEMRMDLVRVGILQYGFWPSKEIFIEHVIKKNQFEDPLKRLITWKSVVMSTKNVKTGEFVGYGNSFLAQTDMKIATVPIGYSHGYARSLSNMGRVLVQGHRVAVVGLINMNALVLDITEVPHVSKGAEVVLIGKQGDLDISVSSFSELSDQLNYELLTRLPADIPRIITE